MQRARCTHSRNIIFSSQCSRFGDDSRRRGRDGERSPAPYRQPGGRPGAGEQREREQCRPRPACPCQPPLQPARRGDRRRRWRGGGVGRGGCVLRAPGRQHAPNASCSLGRRRTSARTTRLNQSAQARCPGPTVRSARAPLADADRETFGAQREQVVDRGRRDALGGSSARRRPPGRPDAACVRFTRTRPHARLQPSGTARAGARDHQRS